MAQLEGQVARVTGAAQGIGKAIALELACRGAAVPVNCRTRRDRAEELAEEIRKTGVPGMAVPGNVAIPEEACAVVETVTGAWKRLDILVNNAGFTRDRSLRKLAGDEWSDVIKVNLNGTFYTTRAAIPVMKEQRYGRVINITSLVDQDGGFGHFRAGAGKGGVVAFIRSYM
ncbi:MAG: SDR family NAD(P)-dependent oxidoreductase [Acidobacteria bacterium]|nr:SDR family NAD(P)-dependent oxidoreductase [Acidobacteriota bacterium]